MKTLSLENLKPKVDSHSREVFWVTGLAWPKWSLRSLPHSRVMVVLFYLSCFIYLSTSISSQKTSGQQPAGFRGEGGSGNCLIPETILTVFRPHHTSKKTKKVRTGGSVNRDSSNGDRSFCPAFTVSLLLCKALYTARPTASSSSQPCAGMLLS